MILRLMDTYIVAFINRSEEVGDSESIWWSIYAELQLFTSDHETNIL